MAEGTLKKILNDGFFKVLSEVGENTEGKIDSGTRRSRIDIERKLGLTDDRIVYGALVHNAETAVANARPPCSGGSTALP
jgi:hypothetical protein